MAFTTEQLVSDNIMVFFPFEEHHVLQQGALERGREPWDAIAVSDQVDEDLVNMYKFITQARVYCLLGANITELAAEWVAFGKKLLADVLDDAAQLIVEHGYSDRQTLADLIAVIQIGVDSPKDLSDAVRILRPNFTAALDLVDDHCQRLVGTLSPAQQLMWRQDPALLLLGGHPTPLPTPPIEQPIPAPPVPAAPIAPAAAPAAPATRTAKDVVTRGHIKGAPRGDYLAHRKASKIENQRLNRQRHREKNAALKARDAAAAAAAEAAKDQEQQD